jgi:uncharacterized iron-regulated membrane protein
MAGSGAGVSRQGLRKAWLKVHRWVALALMVLLIPLGLSGVVLAWDDTIDHAINPQRYAVSGTATLAPSAYIAAARATLGPDERVSMLRYADKDGGPVTLIATAVPKDKGGIDKGAGHKGARGGQAGPPKRVTLWLDPPSARVLDRESGSGGLVRLAHAIHGNMLLPAFGRAVVGCLGVAMFLLAGSGVWLWWPPMGRWVRWLRWGRGDRRLDTNLHHTIGFWIALPLAAQAFTGAWIAWPQMIAMVGLGGPAANRPRAVPLATPSLAPDAALAAARTVTPGAPLAIAWPTSGREGGWRVTLDTAKGSSDIGVDDATGAAKLAKKREGGGLADAVRRLHDGRTLGFYWRMVMVLIGLSPIMLGITGLLMWLRNRHWRNPKRARREPVLAEAETVSA